MGVSNLNYYNERYKGTLSDEQCQIIENLMELKDNSGVVSDLVHSIKLLSDDEIDNIIENYEAFGRILLDKEYGYGKLLDYQTISVACMYYAGNCILGDSVGMGKTVEIAGLMNILKGEIGDSFRYLFLTEKKPSSQVRREMIKFTGDFAHLIPSADKKDLGRFMQYNSPEDELDYSIVGTHGLLKADIFVSWLKMYADEHSGQSPFEVLIVDESSVLGSSKSDITKSFKTLRKYFNRIIFLNATPFEHNLRIFYTQLDLLDKTFLPTIANFQKEYCVMDYRGMYPRPTNKYKNKAQFRRNVAYRYFASTRRDNGAVMEGCSGGIIVSELSKSQRRLLERTSLPRMVYDCPNALDNTIEFNEENVPKLTSLKNLLEGACVDAQTVLIFCHFKEAQVKLSEWLANRGYSNFILNGDTSYEDSQGIITGFRNGAFKILITNIQKSLNFNNCDYCIFYTVEPNPSKMVQFEGRMTRSFDIYDKHVYILCSKGGEYETLTKVIKERAQAMSDMTSVDYSVVMDVLLGGGADAL